MRWLRPGWMLSLCFWVLCAGLSAQFPAPQSPGNQTGEVRTLSGTVVNSVTGEPIPHALVRVMAQQWAAAFTGPDGHFEIPNVPKQPISVGVEKPGYSGAARAGIQISIGGRPFVQCGPTENNITLKLTPSASIHGRILSDQGEPVEGVQVQVLTERIIAGRKSEQPTGGANTDDNGEYKLDNLTPGTYFLRTSQRPLYRMSIALPAAQLAYQAEFYPDAPDRAGAQALQIQPGQTVEADFTLKLIQTYRLTGVMSGFGNGPVMAGMESSSGDQNWTSVQLDRRTGRFTLSAVPAGSWTFTFRSNQGNGPNNLAYAEEQIEVNSNMANLRVALQPVFPIPVTIVHPPDSGNQPGTRPQPNIQLISREHSEAGPFFRPTYFATRPQQQDSSAPDTLEFRGVPPGRYQVSVHTFGLECLDTVSSGSTDLTHGELTVSEGSPPAPISVSLRGDCGTVSGAVQTQGPTEPVYMLLVPDSGIGEPVTTAVQPSAQFTIAGLRPDSYHVYVVPDINNLEYTNPEALRNLNGQEVTLGANEKATLTLSIGGDQ